MKPDPKAEPRCAECEDGYGSPQISQRHCWNEHLSDAPLCTQDDGPAPEWCPKRGDKKEGPYR